MSDGWRGARPLPPGSDGCLSADADQNSSDFSEQSQSAQISGKTPWTAPILVRAAATGDAEPRPDDCQGNVDAVDAEYESWDKTISLVVQADRDLEVAELRLRYQVAEARRAGHSWAIIGASLGISRQAAQQRFGSRNDPQS